MTKDEKERRAYERPVLTTYGSVRNLTGGSLQAGNDAPFPAGKNSRSERRIKENIARIGTHPLGFGVYLYDYRAPYRIESGEGRQFGVIAEEVRRVVPEAVAVDPEGFAVVDYAALGITRH